MKRNLKLDYRQEKFCNEYMRDNNATQAAIRAGYSEDSARSRASRLMKMPAVQNYIQELQTAVSEKYKVTTDRIINELAIIAFADMADLFTENDTIKPYHELSPEIRRAISTINVTNKLEEKRAQHKLSFKMHSKTAAINLLGKHLGYFKLKELEEMMKMRFHNTIILRTVPPEDGGNGPETICDEYGTPLPPFEQQKYLGYLRYGEKIRNRNKPKQVEAPVSLPEKRDESAE